MILGCVGDWELNKVVEREKQVEETVVTSSGRLAEWIELVSAMGADKIFIYKQAHLHPKVPLVEKNIT